MILTLKVPGPPVGKQRARTFTHRQSGRIVSMTPRKTATQESYIKALFVHKYPGHVPFVGALELELVISLPIPKSASKTRAKDMRWQRVLPVKKPDCSNVLKLVEDALNGLAYKDDAQIVDEHVTKQYSDTPGVEVKIIEIGAEV